MISYAEMIRVFGTIGLMSFGGPAAQIALMHRVLVEERTWLTEAQFLRALSFCMLLPGPEAMQLATYAGWKLRGVTGGLIAGALFVLPGAMVMAVLALLYGAYGGLPWMQALFIGVKATVLIIVIEAILRLSRRALKRRTDIVIAVLAFLALFALNLPFPVVIAAAALWGGLRASGPVLTPPDAAPLRWAPSLRVLFIGGLLWAIPILWAVTAGQVFLTDLGLFFSKLAVVTFGGAYAVLAYMTQAVVLDYGWINTAQMIDALGLAETTPGPLILVTQFVGMVAGMAQGGVALALLAGLMVLWVTFVPCFIWIFAGAPLIDWLEGRPRLSGALAAITAAVVGVIANLSLWFALHTLFAELNLLRWGGLQILWPEVTSLQPVAAGLAVFAGWLILRQHWSLVRVLPLAALLSLTISALTGVL